MQSKEEKEALLVELYAELSRYGGGFRGCACPHAVDDAVQDAMLEILDKMPDYQVHSSFKGLANLIVRRKFLRLVEKSKCQARLLEGYGVMFSGISDEADNPLNIVIRNERKERVWQAIQSLSELDRMAAGLRYYEGYSYEDIAEVMGFDDEEAVNTCLRRARRHIEQYLKLMEKGGAA
ncbi:MAG: RNA polymerase sigma factor [Planctomycetota bacterium]